MLHGDISNKSCPIIAFNIDSLLFIRSKNNSPIEKVKDAFRTEKGKYLTRPLNKEFVYTINNVWRNYTLSVYFVTEKEFIKDIEEFLVLHSVPFTSIYRYTDLFDLRDFVNNRCIYYFDTNEEILSFISANHALHYRELYKKLRHI